MTTVVLLRGSRGNRSWTEPRWTARRRAQALADLHSVDVQVVFGVLLVNANGFYRDPPPIDHTDRRRYR